MESVRTRSRGKKDSWRCTTDETDVDEDDEERSVPVVSGENKRKRAPRGSSVRRVKLKHLTHYEDNPGGAEDDNTSHSTHDSKGGRRELEHGAVTSSEFDRIQTVERRRESSRVKIKPIKFRENADEKPAKSRESKREQKEHVVSADEDTDDEAAEEPVPVPEPQKKGNDKSPQKTTVAEANQGNLEVKVRSKQSGDTKLKTPATAQKAPAVSPVPQKPSSTTVTLTLPKTPAQSKQKLDSRPQDGSPGDSSSKHEDDDPDDELAIALRVLRKIMKMEAAQPFNRPVDPIAEGIPDYLEVIDRPMDFGTICDFLEKREKYKTAFDVHKDIQQVWANCKKYNRKEDPIVDLMKKVQKACSKHWTAAGVLRQAKKAPEGVPVVEQPAPAEIFIAKTSSRDEADDLSNKNRPAAAGVGTSTHSATCQCVVCAAMRRKQKRSSGGLGSSKSGKRHHSKSKSGAKQGTGDAIDMDDFDIDSEEEEHFYPATYQLPLRKLNPKLLLMGQFLFGSRQQKQQEQQQHQQQQQQQYEKSINNPFFALVSAYSQCT